MTALTDPPALPAERNTEHGDTDTPAGNIPQQSYRTSRNRAFVTWIEQICVQDAGARAALRSGLRKDIDSVPRMHRLVAPWLPENNLSGDTARAYYATAAMIASQPRNAPTNRDTDRPDDSTKRKERAVGQYGTSLGATFAAAVADGPGREKQMRAGPAESRLNLLTRQSVSGLHRHLPASVGYLRSLSVPVDWVQLLDDLSNWRKHSGQITRRWLQDFYRLSEQHAQKQADTADQQELTDPAPPPAETT
ncbi:type I-E CRISPR-associated protein Cse2/CasB [Streptomyces sp. NBC_01500]|uniref:type I-E CRISPR-associated protein Cse2/CasB n=1 Tax=Streptomyces sp. NBC_01500 TaxID=2903886 RepID=UPI002252E6AF|nr:type I-E CRISPR-associated protein Cse2/CasB [Streptomyces sp. NBC_01500]MCX4554286.1 type I-E CRISPR-associated protein Cse2/CasB [Streptomyces sp. NBC_01500]